MISDLHVHLGGAVPSPVLWEIAQEQGLDIPHKSFMAFQNALSNEGKKHHSLDDFLGTYFHLTEFIQSSPTAIATSIYQTIAKSYRRAETELLEIRFNPAKRLRGGTHSMDSILLAACQGLEKACLHYQIQAGIILSLGRDCTIQINEQILEAAIRWHQERPQIIVGIDLAGSESTQNEHDLPWLKKITKLFQKAKAHGLKTTLHTGETPHTGWKGVQLALQMIRPNRIGHGIELRNAPAKTRSQLLDILAATQTCLEICPSVNLATSSIKNIQELRDFTGELTKHNCPWIIATDNPYLIHTNPKQEEKLLSTQTNPEDCPKILQAREQAQKNTFLPKKRPLENPR